MSAMLNMCAIFEKHVNADLQWQLVQYFLPGSTGSVTYLDYFDVVTGLSEIPYLHACESWQLAFAHASVRHMCAGKPAMKLYYDHVIEHVRKKLALDNIVGGSLYVALKRLKLSRKKCVWATYWTEKDASNITKAFASATHAFQDNTKLRKHKNFLIKFKVSKNTKRFQAVEWKNVILINTVNLITTESAGSAPPIIELYADLPHNEKIVPNIASDEDRVTALSIVFRNRINWLYSKFSMEWLSAPAYTLVGMSYNAILHKIQTTDPTVIGLEQLNQCYSHIICTFNRGGLSYASLPHISRGDKLGPVHNKAQSVAT